MENGEYGHTGQRGEVEEGGHNNVQLVGVEGHTEGNPVVAEEAEGGRGSESDGGDEPTLACHRVDAQEVGFKRGSQRCHLPLDKGDGGSKPPPPPPACLHPEIPPTPPSTPFGGSCNASFIHSLALSPR